jgi:hypothetical protein
MEGGSVTAKSAQDSAMMALVYTDRGRHRERVIQAVIQVLARKGGPSGHWSEQFDSRKEAYDVRFCPTAASSC